jgi:hypothetical protein
MSKGNIKFDILLKKSDIDNLTDDKRLCIINSMTHSLISNRTLSIEQASNILDKVIRTRSNYPYRVPLIRFLGLVEANKIMYNLSTCGFYPCIDCDGIILGKKYFDLGVYKPIMYEYSNGDRCWVIGGKNHREDGPAIEMLNGYKEWIINGKTHRIGGPAREFPDGRKEWWINGKMHRINGPAIEDGVRKQWYINGAELSEEEWKNLER